jgi:hypothetical protein
MSVTRDNTRKILDIHIKKIIPKNIKKNLVEYDSNPFEKKIEEKINIFHKGKIEKQTEKKLKMLYDRDSKIDNILLSLEKNKPYLKVLNNDIAYKSKSKLKNNLRRSSANDIINNNNTNDTYINLNESFHFKDHSLINNSSKIELKINKNKEDNLPLRNFSPNPYTNKNTNTNINYSLSSSYSPLTNKKLALNNFAKKDLEKARKKREEKLKEYSIYSPQQQNTILNNIGNI